MHLEKGYQFRIDIETVKVEEFAKIILALVNTKSSNNQEFKIVDIETLAGTNLIVVTAKEDIESYLSQLTGGEIKKTELVLATVTNESAEDILNSNVYVENKKLFDEVESVYDIHIVGEQSI